MTHNTYKRPLEKLDLDSYYVLKNYPTFSRLYEYLITVDDLYWFANNPKRSVRIVKKQNNEDRSQSELDSIRRTKTVISDLMLCNHFDMFATFTFNGDEKNRLRYGYAVTDRSDTTQVKAKMSKWLKNQRELHGKFEYLIVPEFHKKQNALHFHALMKGYKGNLSSTKIRQGGRTVYNLKGYRLGHSTVVKIGDSEEDYRKVASYIKKYITKDMPLFDNKKRYWCSKELTRPEKISNVEITPFDFSLFEHTYSKNTINIYTSKTRIVVAEEARAPELFAIRQNCDNVRLPVQIKLQGV